MSSVVLKNSKKHKMPQALGVWTLSTVALGMIVLFLVRHWDYYSLVRLQRPLHHDHVGLRPSGSSGLAFGMTATILFVLNLGYLARKQIIRVSGLGSLRSWMNVHVLTGLIGAGLTGLHCAVAPASPLGVLAIVAMAVTVITGIVGRTIHIQVPRSLEGRELGFQQVQDQLDGYRDKLQHAGVQADWLQLSRPEARAHRTGLAGGFLSMVIGDHQRRQDYRRLKRQVLGSLELEPAARQILPLAKEFCIHWQWLVRYHELRSLIASWRFFHRWLAVLMFWVVVCHIVLAVRFGDLVIWGGTR